MAKEILVAEDVGLSIYVIIFDVSNQVWNNTTSAFESIISAHWSHYAIELTDSTATGLYFGDFPVGITTAGDYPVVAYLADVPGTPAVGDSTIPGATEVMHWDGSAELQSSLFAPSDVVAELYASFVVNTTTFQKIMQGLAAVNLGNLVEATDHTTSVFTDVNDSSTTRVTSENTTTTRDVTLD